MLHRLQCRTAIYLGGLLLSLSAVTSPCPADAARDSRPFWTEKSAFIEGDDLFVVGVASKAKTAEEGRQRAFEHGKIELMNYAQITDLEAQGLVIETQMTHEEPNSDGTVSVFRLLRVPAPKLIAIQGRLQTQSKAQEEAIEQARSELAAIQESLAQKQQEVEARAQGVQDTLTTVSRLQASLTEKAQRIEQQQRQVEQLLQQVTKSLQTSPKAPKGQVTGRSLVENLRQVEAQLDEREHEVEAMYRRTQERIGKQSRKACRYVTHGMKPEEVEKLLGKPDGMRYDFSDRDNQWAYGTIQVWFDGVGLVSLVKGCGR